MKLLDAPLHVRAFVCDLYLKDAIKGPLWKVYETQEYDLDTDTATIDGVAFKVRGADELPHPS